MYHLSVMLLFINNYKFFAATCKYKMGGLREFVCLGKGFLLAFHA